MRLSRSNVSSLDAKCAVPSRDLNAQQVGIVHIGPGAFHRAHQAKATEFCLEAGQTEWAICGVSLRSAAFAEDLDAQDGLYCLLERDEDKDRLQIIGAIDQAYSLTQSWPQIIEQISDPAIRIVTLTVTEKGYGADPQTRKLNDCDPAIAHDLENPDEAPQSVVGLLMCAIAMRQAKNIPQFTCLSCDNLSHNGALLRSVLIEFAQKAGHLGLIDVINSMSFPSSMVDRITPATMDADRKCLSDEFGIEDHCVVIAEPFFQWVIEDDFANGRPSWELAGAEFVQDVTAHEMMKLRMLNGAHSILAAIGQTVGKTTIAQTVRLPGVEDFLHRYWVEVTKTLSDDLDAAAYAQKLLARFRSPALEHRVDQISSDVSQKIQQRLVPPFQELACQSDVISLGLAIIIRACASHNEKGQEIQFSDPDIGTRIQKMDLSIQPDERLVAQYVGSNIETKSIVAWLRMIQSTGLAQTLKYFNTKLE